MIIGKGFNKALFFEPVNRINEPLKNHSAPFSSAARFADQIAKLDMTAL